jgi:hypothetical protein
MNSETQVIDSVEEAEEETYTSYRECDPSAECLFQGRDEVGREGWFLRIEVMGMFPRRCGPFETREEALKILDGFANKVIEGYVDVMNDMDMPEQLTIVEGVPQLTAMCN